MCSNNIYFEYQDLDILGKIVVKVIHITSSLLTFIFRYFWQKLRLMRWNTTFDKGHVANIKGNKSKKWLLKSHTNIKRKERSDYREKIRKEPIDHEFARIDISRNKFRRPFLVSSSI